MPSLPKNTRLQPASPQLQPHASEPLYPPNLKCKMSQCSLRTFPLLRGFQVEGWDGCASGPTGRRLWCYRAVAGPLLAVKRSHRGQMLISCPAGPTLRNERCSAHTQLWARVAQPLSGRAARPICELRVGLALQRFLGACSRLGLVHAAEITGEEKPRQPLSYLKC